MQLTTVYEVRVKINCIYCVDIDNQITSIAVCTVDSERKGFNFTYCDMKAYKAIIFITVDDCWNSRESIEFCPK